VTYGQRSLLPRDSSKRANPPPQIGFGGHSERARPSGGGGPPARGRVARGAYREVRARPRPATPSRLRPGWGPADGLAGRGGGREGERGRRRGGLGGGVPRRRRASSGARAPEILLQKFPEKKRIKYLAILIGFCFDAEGIHSDLSD